MARKLLGVILVFLTAVWLTYLHYYPYGRNHSCDLQLIQALHDYALQHGGCYPAGEVTPEASLSLLYPEFANECVLQGKTVPLEKVKSILESGQRLGPDSCGWHYVEGLKIGDDLKLAIFWDKVGLGHNGERLSVSGHNVFFLDQFRKFISDAEWPAFLEEQERLMKNKVALEKKCKTGMSDFSYDCRIGTVHGVSITTRTLDESVRVERKFLKVN